MTHQRTIIIDFKDVKALEVRCGQCEGVTSFPLTHDFPVEVICQSCRELLVGTRGGELSRVAAANALFDALKNWKAAKTEGCRLTFTLVCPPGEG